MSVPSTPLVRRDFFHEASNTLKASAWTLMLAHLFGKRIDGYDTELQTNVKLREWRGKTEDA